MTKPLSDCIDVAKCVCGDAQVRAVTSSDAAQLLTTVANRFLRSFGGKAVKVFLMIAFKTSHKIAFD